MNNILNQGGLIKMIRKLEDQYKKEDEEDEFKILEALSLADQNNIECISEKKDIKN